MFRFHDRRIRWALAILLLALIGVSGYHAGRNAWSDWHYRRAREALEHFEFSQASAHLKKSISLSSPNPDRLMLAAQTARRQGNFGEASRLLARAHQQGAPSDALHLEQRLLQIQQGELTSADPFFQLCQDQPGSPEAAIALEAIVEGSLNAKEYPLACWGAELWLKHQLGSANQAQGFYWRARAHQIVEDFPKAEADFLQAIETAPNHYLARLWLATFLIEKEPARATVHVNWLRQNRPDEMAVRFQCARLQRNLGRPDEAAVLLDQVLISIPETSAAVPILLERGRVEMDLHRPEKALPWIRRAREINPGSREVNLAFADCLRQARQIDAASSYLKLVQEIDALTAKMKKEREKTQSR